MSDAGVPYREIAQQFDLDRRTIIRVVEQSNAQPSHEASRALPEPEIEPVVIDPRHEVCRALAELRQVTREARRLAGEARQESTQVAALKLLASLPLQRIELLGEFGALPPGPQWLSEVRGAAVWRALLEVAHAAGLDIDELRTAAKKRVAEHISYEKSDGMLELAPLAPLARRPMQEVG